MSNLSELYQTKIVRGMSIITQEIMQQTIKTYNQIAECLSLLYKD